MERKLNQDITYKKRIYFKKSKKRKKDIRTFIARPFLCSDNGFCSARAEE